MSNLPYQRTVAWVDDFAKPADPGRRDTDWAVRERDFSLHGRRFHYVGHGSGAKTFLFVHGVGGRRLHWRASPPSPARIA